MATAADGQIVAVRVRALAASTSDAIRMSFGRLTRRSMVLIELEAACGAIGWGESWVNHPYWSLEERLATIHRGVAPMLIGEDSGRIAYLHHKLLARLLPLGRQWGAAGPIHQAVSGVEMALWDLTGHMQSAPVSALLGGRVRERVAIYASSLEPDTIDDLAPYCRSAGVNAVKVKVGFGPAQDRITLEAAREALGKDIYLMVDANQAWDLQEALKMTKTLKDSDVQWVEEPLRDNSLNELEDFVRTSGLPIATGENVYGSAAFAPYALSPFVRVLQPDVSKCGGLLDAFTISQLGRSAGKVVNPHLYNGALAYAATLQLAAVSPATEYVEYDVRANPLRDPLLRNPPVPSGGTVPIPASPGLGAELNLDAVKEHTIAMQEVVQ